MQSRNKRDNKSRRPLLPLFLDLRSRLVVIFGGGNVGERKARLFSQYGPVRVLSRDFSPGLLDLVKDQHSQIELVECDLSSDFAKVYAGCIHRNTSHQRLKIKSRHRRGGSATGNSREQSGGCGRCGGSICSAKGLHCHCHLYRNPGPYQVSSPPAGRKS